LNQMMRTVGILGIPFLSTDMNGLVNMLDKRLEEKKKTFLVTANPEILMYAKNHPDYDKTLKKADFVIPDGIGVVIGSRILGDPIPERLAGFDLVFRLFELAEKKGYTLYFLGARPDVIAGAAERVTTQFPRIKIVGFHHGYFDMEDTSVIEDIKSKAPDILLVGLGFPKQEEWIDRYGMQLDKGLMIGVGGTFDGITGRVKRAPEIWRKLNVEWLYRLIQQPSRWRRMLALPQFMAVILREKMKR